MTKFLKRSLLALSILLLLTIAACNEAEEPAVSVVAPVEQAQAETWEQFVTRQIEAQIDAMLLGVRE